MNETFSYDYKMDIEESEFLIANTHNTNNDGVNGNNHSDNDNKENIGLLNNMNNVEHNNFKTVDGIIVSNERRSDEPAELSFEKCMLLILP